MKTPPTPFQSSSPEDTQAHASMLAQAFPHSLVLLYGDMGSGKTVWTQGFAAGLGINGHIHSPTYTIMNIYRKESIVLYHIDLYRINNFEELVDLGLFEILDAKYPCVIEWPKQVTIPLDLPHLEIKIENAEAEMQRLIHWRWCERGRLP